MTENLLEESNLYRAVLESVSEGVIICDINAKLLYFNPAAEKLLGSEFMQSSAQEWGQAYGLYMPDRVTPMSLENYPTTKALKGEKIQGIDMYIRDKKRQTGIFVRSSADPIKNASGQIIGGVAVFEDISKELELQRTKDEFFSIASHELRTPLTAIRGNTSLIRQYFWDQLTNEDLRDMMNDIHESSIRLIDIVNDFLDSSRLEQNRMKFNIEPFDVVGLAYAALKEYQVTGSRQHIALDVVRPAQPVPLVLGDQNRTKQVLINLIGNALKFTTQGSVKVNFSVSDDKFVKVLVSDTGQGITPDAQQKLFQKYEQSDHGNTFTRDAVRGTGLGLYICRMMIQAMNGSIQLEHSEINKGSTFSFTLPIFHTPSTGIKHVQEQ